MAGRLEDRVAIVTGAGGPRGIGRAIALSFAREGAHVVVAGGRQAAQAGEEIRALNRRCLALPTDVSNQAHVQSMVEPTLGEFGRIDILVNNAAILLRGHLHEVTLPDWERTLAVNLTGVLLCCQSVVPAMIARGRGGRIINISSACPHIGCSAQVAHAASKGGVEAMTLALAVDLADHGITVNAIVPGNIYTGMTREAPRGQQPTRWDGTPIPKVGLPQDVAGAAVYLASPDANWVTGTLLRADGGFLAGR